MFLQDNNSSDTGALAQTLKRAILTLALSESYNCGVVGIFQILEESFKYGKVGDKVIEWDKDQRGELSLLGWKSTKFKRQMITFWFLSQFVCFRTFLVGFRKCTVGNFQFYGDWIKCHFMAKYRKS